MSKLSKRAFATMAMCEKTKEPFGITIDPRDGCYAFVWAFKIKQEQAKREGYDQTHVRGAVTFDEHFNGCPHCGAKNFYVCSSCGRVICYHGQEFVTCPNCGSSSMLQTADSVDLSGGGF